MDKLHQVFRVRRGNKNKGMKEDNLLSLSYGRIIQKSIETADGLLPENFEGYQIVEPGNIVLRLTDLQNDKRSLRQGLVTQRGIITSAYDAVEVQRDNDPRFWFYSLLALDLAKHYYSLGGGVRQSVKFADFPNDWVYCPALATQRRIAGFLDRETARLDLLIGKKRGMLELLGEKRSALIAAAVTGGLDPASGQPVVAKTAARPSAAGGGRVTFPKVGYLIRPLATSSTIKNTVELEQADDLFPGYSASGQDVWLPYYDYDGPAIVLSAVGAQCGKTFLADGKWGTVANTTAFGIDTSKASPKFLHYMTNQKDFWEKGGSAQPYVKVSETLRKRFFIPDLATQRRIAGFLDRETARLDLLMAKIDASIDLLRERRAALITAAVTGQIDVPTSAKSDTPGTPDHPPTDPMNAPQEETSA
ncbi:MAG: restriction endonuclease subunit S [Rhodospirillales bacterium]|nr:restriction endonuclease subunit S [Rhodospirillales bacterium]